MSEYIVDIADNPSFGGVLITCGEIVRCRDCKHYRKHEFVLVTDVSDVCLFWASGVKVAPDGFCAWAERKEGGE